MTEKRKYTQIGSEAHGLCIAAFGCDFEGNVFPVRCKQWNCPICAPWNAYKWAVIVANGVRALQAAGVVLRFVTITQNPKIKSAEYAYSILDDQWNKFQLRLHRYYDKFDPLNTDPGELVWELTTPARDEGLPMIYAAFVEGQGYHDNPKRKRYKSGMPHFHILLAFAPPIEQLRHMIVKSGLGYEVDSQPIQPNSGTAWYVSKYSTKSSDAKAMPKYFRRCRLSENWPRLVWRSDAREGAAIIQKPTESLGVWAKRAAHNVGVMWRTILDRAIALSDQQWNQAEDEQLLESLPVDYFR